MGYLKAGVLAALVAVCALVFGVASAKAVESPAAVTVTKSVVGPFDATTHTFGTAPAYFKAGDTVTYKYVVTANDRFVSVNVTDSNCSPVQPVLGLGANSAHNIGDTGYYDTSYHNTGVGDDVLNGYAGEAWQFYCTKVLPAVNPSNDIPNTATVDAAIYTTPTIHRTDTDSYKLEAMVLRKQVVLFWDYIHWVTAPGTGDVAFDVTLSKGGTPVGGTEHVSANTPLGLYLTEGGPWVVTEGTPPTGYTVARGGWTIGTLPAASGYLDNTF
ncbi:MAG TPA: hypothetical protein VLN26_04020, partial [Gaiellaceae bacterium]|nr:hypothetical protein [Gaiellaceae bacterium]